MIRFDARSATAAIETLINECFQRFRPIITLGREKPRLQVRRVDSDRRRRLSFARACLWNRWMSAYRFASVKPYRTIIHVAVTLLLSIPATAQVPIAPEQQASVADATTQPTLIQIVPYVDEMQALPVDSPPSCYRIGRCSAYDLWRFRDRPNRLTRLAPMAPDAQPPSVYLWYLVPVTPEENILPNYRSASQVRDEYRAVGAPIDAPN